MSDLPQLTALLQVLFREEAEFVPDEAKQRVALAAILADPALGRVYTAREADGVLAMASLLFTVSTAEGGKAAWLEDLVVLPGHRGRGIGTALLGYVIQQARLERVRRLTLLTDGGNLRAQALYRKLGFAPSPMKPMRLRL